MQKKSLWRIFTALSLIIISATVALILAITPRQFVILLRMTAATFLIGVAWLCWEIRIWSKSNVRYIAEMSTLLSDAGRSLPELLPMPVAILNDAREFVWYNSAFDTEITHGEDFFGHPMADLFPKLHKQLSENSYADITIYSHTYRVTESECRYANGTTYVLNFQDTTNFTDLRKRYWDSRLCVLLIVIDNYEDLMGGAKQSERASVLAQLEQLLDHAMEGTESVFYRLDADRFLMLLEAQYYVQMEHDRFPILDEVRKIVVGGKNALTLSIGVGRSGASLAENEAFAEQSLDMAMGRGGDQAAVKTKSGYNFYGGVTKAVEKRSKTRYRAVARAFRELLETTGNVYIMGHRLSDLDAVGAAIGMAFITEHLGKKPAIVLNSKATLARPLVERLMLERPDYLVTPETAAAQFQANDLLIIVDTFSKDLLDAPAVYQKAKNIMVIDHHRKMVNFVENTTLLLHDPNASSASELATEMLQYLECRDEMPPFCAEALLSGIMLDTKNFVMQTGVHTFEAAAYLRERGADPVVVKPLFAATMSIYRQRSLLVSNAEIYGRYAIAVANEPTPDIQIIAAQTADDLLGIEGVDASFVLFPRDNLACISARSLGKTNVQVVMENLGGGGHQTMAATQLKDCSMRALRNMLIEALDELDAVNGAE